ncbi:bifunctional folylpolyglutamate synthase/dihydrofolate synthase [Schaalia canis]|uniref:Dihydrofolate synthase/folylpolyglutamate synthase n=1 Tax=Schaalia canis TaxID=100469 RepID=A0A3P1SDR3_9ACTO|nr:folylpolyglutamate synthase/dihydrofolate synthase family protein [Schaalia canis]RRC95176.1 bifunctional folylpolyglutamate synthase/dihydrofolate synthase [Schaalia canis]
MGNDHAAFFGHDTEETRGIPADLLPYLEAADEVEADNITTGVALVNEEEAAEEERAAVLRALVENSLLLGPDPSILAELGLDEDDDYWEGEEDSAAQTASHEDALDAAEQDLRERDSVEAIYQSIIARAPEHDIQPSLDRVRAVLDILGDPQHTYPSVHITGTNGKTSTARMTDSLLSAMGMRVGRFTSPHLSDVRERISLEGEPISRAGFIRAWEDIAPYIQMVDERSTSEGGPVLSFFEVFTVMALAAFADYPVDAAVVEVGLGGRWDATNVLDGDVAIITPIGLDHTAWLGPTLEDIAREKTGIIKPRQTVVIAKQPSAEVLDILLERARECDATVRVEGRDWEVLSAQIAVGGQMITVRTPSAIYEDLFIPLHGEHQAHNAAAALVAAEAFIGGRAIDGQIVECGFASSSSPGRLEVVRTSPTIIVDAAHNPAGARVLADAIGASFDFTRIVAVFSAMKDKDVESVLSEVEPHIDHLVVTAMDGQRAMSIGELERLANDVFGEERVTVAENLADAIEVAVHDAEATSDPTTSTGVVVFGSVVLAGQTRDLLRPAR